MKVSLRTLWFPFNNIIGTYYNTHILLILLFADFNHKKPKLAEESCRFDQLPTEVTQSDGFSFLIMKWFLYSHSSMDDTTLNNTFFRSWLKFFHTRLQTIEKTFVSFVVHCMKRVAGMNVSTFRTRINGKNSEIVDWTTCMWLSISFGEKITLWENGIRSSGKKWAQEFERFTWIHVIPVGMNHFL